MLNPDQFPDDRLLINILFIKNNELSQNPKVPLNPFDSLS